MIASVAGRLAAKSVDRVVIEWPSGRSDEFKNVATGRAYECVEGKALMAQAG